MPKKFFLLLILHPCLLFANPVWISQNEDNEEIDELDAYDPFTDYIDFQDSESEEEDMTFFKTGRMLSVGGYLGYRHFVFLPDQERNTTNSPNYGAFIKSFLSLHIAIQFSYVGSVNLFAYTHENSIYQARTIYHNFGAEFRYYWNRSQLVRALARLNPYIFGGFLVTRRTFQKPVVNNIISHSTNNGGLKGGFGLEFHVSTRVYLGLHAEYNFMFIQQSDCVTSANQNICPPENTLNAMFVLGRNF